MRNNNKNRAAQALGRLGGKARARKLTREQRSESARKAANARHARNKADDDRRIEVTTGTGSPDRTAA